MNCLFNCFFMNYLLSVNAIIPIYINNEIFLQELIPSVFDAMDCVRYESIDDVKKFEAAPYLYIEILFDNKCKFEVNFTELVMRTATRKYSRTVEDFAQLLFDAFLSIFGVSMPHIINEPTALAIMHGLDKKRYSECDVLIYDTAYTLAAPLTHPS